MPETCEPGAKEADYLDRQARYCPHCRTDHIRREFDSPHVMREPDASPTIRVLCYCCRCSRVWFENYALAGVDI